MRSTLIVLAAAIGFAVAEDCNYSAVSSCVMPYVSAVAECSDVPCACSALSAELACYPDLCPAATIPAVALDAYTSLCQGDAITSAGGSEPTSVESSEPTSVESSEPTSDGSSEPTSDGNSEPTSTGSGSGDSDSTITSAPNPEATGVSNGGENVQQTTSKAAADMLLVPAGGLVAGLIGVLAWL